MTFEQLFGQMRSLCHAPPSSKGFSELVSVSRALYSCDSQRFNSSVFDYLVDTLHAWPQKLMQCPSMATCTELKDHSSLLFVQLLEDMLDNGFDVQSDFVRDYCIHMNCILSPFCLDGACEVPLNLSSENLYDFVLGKNFRPHLDEFTVVQKFLIRYLMMYEQNHASYEALYSKYIESKLWKDISRLGDVGPQHGLFECELQYIKKHTGIVFPQAVVDFYKLFGRLSGHALGNADNIVNPYTYIDGPYRCDTHLIFLWENQGGWDWGYEISNESNPKMILFEDFAENEFGKQREDASHLFKNWPKDYMSKYEVRFADFVRFDRAPWNPEAMSYR